MSTIRKGHSPPRDSDAPRLFRPSLLAEFRVGLHLTSLAPAEDRKQVGAETPRSLKAFTLISSDETSRTLRRSDSHAHPELLRKDAVASKLYQSSSSGALLDLTGSSSSSSPSALAACERGTSATS